MPEQSEVFTLISQRYVISLLIVAAAVPAWFTGGPLFVAGLLLIAWAAFLSTRHLVRQILRTNEQKCSLDQQLIQSQKLAAIGELSSGIAHEINNPLAIIGQEVEWVRHILKEEKVEDPQQMSELKESLFEIARQVDRCREITHKLLDFARKQEPLIQSVDVNRLVEDMARLVEREAISKNIKIVRSYNKDLPFVLTDSPLLRQVVLNLLNNATYAVGKDGEVTIETQMGENGCVNVLVADTGCGIPKEDLNKIFDPFFTTKPPGKGTGLGLSICHGIISRLGGRISVVSEVGKGSAFTIHLPGGERKGEA